MTAAITRRSVCRRYRGARRVSIRNAAALAAARRSAGCESTDSDFTTSTGSMRLRRSCGPERWEPVFAVSNEPRVSFENALRDRRSVQRQRSVQASFRCDRKSCGHRDPLAKKASWLTMRPVFFSSASLVSAVMGKDPTRVSTTSRSSTFRHFMTKLEKAAPVEITNYWSGIKAPAGRSFAARLLWSDNALYVRFEAPKRAACGQRGARHFAKTLGLWDRDVCEIFIAPDTRRQTNILNSR